MEQASRPDQEAVVNALLGARDAMLRIRSNMRQMGEAAGIPVGFLFGLFDSPRAVMELHVQEGIKDTIFIWEN